MRHRAPAQPAPATGYGTLVTLTLGVLAFGAAAVLLGQSANWDLRNYHWYDGWAWLTGRGDRDLAAAQLQTWFNPLLPAAMYTLLSSVPPAVGTFVLGCIQGTNVVLLHRIACALLPGRSAAVTLGAAFVGATGATQLGELGATFGDNVTSLFLLGAIALLVGRFDATRALGAGLLAGLAVGIKLTTAPFAAGIVLAVPLLAEDRRQALRLFTLVAAAAFAGFVAAAGFWMVELWQRYGNPLFPMFGAWFGDEYAPPGDFRDLRWVPRSVLQWLFYPLHWADSPRAVSELWFLDLRVPLLFLAVLALPAWYPRAASPRLRYVLVAIGIGYATWLVLFGYYRYLAVVEMLAPVLLVVAIGAIPLSRRTVGAIVASVLVVVAVTTKPAKWGRLPHYAPRYVDVVLPDAPQLDRATVLLPGDEPLAFLVPAFPATTSFVRVGGNLMGPPHPEWALDRDAARRIGAAQGPLYALIGSQDTSRAESVLARHGLRLDAGDCRAVAANVLHREPPVRLCGVLRDGS